MPISEAEKQHKKMIDRLASKVKGQYSMMAKEVQVRNPYTGEIVGEIDLLGIIDGTLGIYEVKVNDGKTKAKKQLANLRHYLGNCGNIRTFYYSGRSGKLEEIIGQGG